MKLKFSFVLFFIFIFICIVSAQNQENNTWQLPQLTNLGNYNFIDFSPPLNIHKTSKVKTRQFSIEKDKIICKGGFFYTKMDNGKNPYFPEYEGEVEEEYEYEDEEEAYEERDYEEEDYEDETEDDYEYGVEEEEAEEYEKIIQSDTLWIDKRIQHNEEQITIIFHNKLKDESNKVKGFLTLYFINGKRAYLKTDYGFENLPQVEDMRINPSKEDLPIVYTSQEFQDILEKNEFPIDNEEEYYEWWLAYLKEIKKEKNASKLKNLNIDFQINVLTKSHFANQLVQNVLESLDYDLFKSFKNLQKVVIAFGYPEEIRSLIRGKVTEQQISNIQKKISQKWHNSFVIPSRSGFPKEDRNIGEFHIKLDVNYPSVRVDIEATNTPSPLPNEYRSFSMEIKKITMGTDESNGTIILEIPSQFLYSQDRETRYVVLSFQHLSNDNATLSPIGRGDFKTIEEAERLVIDASKNKFEVNWHNPYNPVALTFLSQKEKDRQDKLPVLDKVSFKHIDTLFNKMVKTLELDKNHQNWLKNSKIYSEIQENYPQNISKVKLQTKSRFIWNNRNLSKYILNNMGYNPHKSYVAISSFLQSQGKLLRLQKLEDRLVDKQKRFENIDSYEFKRLSRGIEKLKQDIELAKLEIKLDSLEKGGKGKTEEAKKIRGLIDFEERYQDYDNIGIHGKVFLKNIKSTQKQIEEYLQNQKLLDKKLSKKDKQIQEKQRKENKEKIRKIEEMRDEGKLQYLDRDLLDAIIDGYSLKKDLLYDIKSLLKHNYKVRDLEYDIEELSDFIYEYAELLPERVKPLEKILKESNSLLQNIEDSLDKLRTTREKLRKSTEWIEPLKAKKK